VIELEHELSGFTITLSARIEPTPYSDRASDDQSADDADALNQVYDGSTASIPSRQDAMLELNAILKSVPLRPPFNAS